MPRYALFRVLERIGCGSVILVRLFSKHEVMKSIISTALVKATVGVHQGSSTLCLLFVLFVKDFHQTFQWNRWRSGGLGIHERIGSNTDYGLSGDWASTRGNGPQVGGLSDRRSPLGGLLLAHKFP